MSWQLIKGIEPKPELNIKRCLKLDGVNDYLTLGNNSFYNVGLGEFTIAIDFLKYTNKIPTSLFRTSEGEGQNRPRLTINIEDTLNVLKVRFIDEYNNLDTFTYNFPNEIYSSFTKIVVVRKGNNYSDSDDAVNYPASIRNPDNLFVYINGVLTPRTSLVMTNPKGLNYLIDNPDPKILGGLIGNSVYYFKGYYSLFGYWNRALSLTEVQNINNGILDDYQAKGIFIFDGNTLDSSSVQGTMTLLNSATPTHITYPYKAGVIPFLKSVANQIKNFTYQSTVTITKIWKEQSGYNGFQYSLNGGASWTNIPDGELVTVSIVVPTGTTLQLKDPISRADYNVLHLDFN